MVGQGAPFGASTGSLAERAYYAIRQQLLELAIAPGAPIQEDRLCAELGLGRTPVREAIKRLESERLVVVYPRRGTFASEVNITDHALLADVRRQLEGLGAQRAAERATDEDLAEAERLLARLRGITAGSADLMGIDREVHASLYRWTRNSYLEATLGQYYNLATRIWTAFLSEVDVVAHLASHVDLLEAVRARDPERARELATAHVDDFETAVLRTELEVLSGGRAAPVAAAKDPG
jgi:DNA-binding GntR family transcriptional regulator